MCSSLVDPALRCTQAELLACRSHPRASLSVCDMDTVTAPPTTYNSEKPLKIIAPGSQTKLVHLCQKKVIHLMLNKPIGSVSVDILAVFVSIQIFR